MKKGSAYRFGEPYKLVNGDEEKEDRNREEAANGEGTYLLPITRDGSQVGMLSPEPPEGPRTPSTMAEDKKHNSEDMTTTTLIPLSEVSEEPHAQKKKPEEEKKYIGDNVITAFLQDPLTTLLY